MVLIGFLLVFIGFPLVLIVFLAPGGQVCKGHDYKEPGLQRAVLQRARLQEAWCARTKPSFYRGGDVQHDKPESDRDSTREHRCIKSDKFTWFLLGFRSLVVHTDDAHNNHSTASKRYASPSFHRGGGGQHDNS